MKIFGARRVAWAYGRDERTAAYRRDRDASVDEFLVGERDGVAVDAEIFRQIANRGQSIARFESTVCDLETDVIGNLAVDGPSFATRAAFQGNFHGWESMARSLGGQCHIDPTINEKSREYVPDAHQTMTNNCANLSP